MIPKAESVIRFRFTFRNNETMTPSIIFCINKHVSLFELRIVRIALPTLTYITQLSVINKNIINVVYVGKFDIAVQCIYTKVIKEMDKKKIVVVQ